MLWKYVEEALTKEEAHRVGCESHVNTISM